MSNPIRNIAIIAHVDHGKTTLVDEIIKQVQLFRKNEDMETCLLDSNDLEKKKEELQSYLKILVLIIIIQKLI